MAYVILGYFSTKQFVDGHESITEGFIEIAQEINGTYPIHNLYYGKCERRTYTTNQLTSAPVTSEVVGSIPSQSHNPSCDRFDSAGFLQGLRYPPTLHYKSPNSV
jgi:hypothetical protein